MKLSVWAKKHGIGYQCAWNMFTAGKIRGAYRLPTGTIIIPDEVDIQLSEKSNNFVVCYSRVSSSQNKQNLESQEKRLLDFCAAKGYVVTRSIKEIGSGLNDQRKQLLSLLKDKSVTKIVVEHKDRLTRFGFEYLLVLLAERGCKIEVINNVSTDEEDLMQDFVSLVTSFCSRLYGRRRTRRSTEKLIESLKEGN